MPKDRKVEATNVASPHVSGWAIVMTWERPDGTWYTETRTEIPDDAAHSLAVVKGVLLTHASLINTLLKVSLVVLYQISPSVISPVGSVDTALIDRPCISLYVVIINSL